MWTRWTAGFGLVSVGMLVAVKNGNTAVPPLGPGEVGVLDLSKALVDIEGSSDAAYPSH